MVRGALYTRCVRCTGKGVGDRVRRGALRAARARERETHRERGPCLNIRSVYPDDAHMILQYCCTLRDVCPASTRAGAHLRSHTYSTCRRQAHRLAGLRASRAVKLALTVLAALSAAQAPSAPAAARSAQPEAVFLANEPAPSSPVSHAAKLVSIRCRTTPELLGSEREQPHRRRRRS